MPRPPTSHTPTSRPLTRRRPVGAGPLTADEIASVRKPFRGASLLPGRAYHDDAIFDWELENWFGRDWLAVAREEEVPRPGSFVVRDVLGESVVIVRGRDSVIRAFYNVCRHRGTAIVEGEAGTAVRFQCPYHAWVYDLDGRLVRAAHTDDLDDFAPDRFGLSPIGLGAWGGFVFISFAPAPTPAPLEAYLDDWTTHHADHGRDFGRLRRVARLDYDVRANWKLVAENYSECYHCPGVHPLLNHLTPYDLGEDYVPDGRWKGGWMPFAEGCETMSMDGLRHGRPLLDGTSPVDARRIHYYILWPNLILSVHPDYVLSHQTWPVASDRSRVVCDLYVDGSTAPRPDLDLAGAVEFWDLTNRQDYHVVELQQRGTASRSWVAGRYSNQEAAVHAFDLMCVDRYAGDGLRTRRGLNSPRTAGRSTTRRSAHAPGGDEGSATST